MGKKAKSIFTVLILLCFISTSIINAEAKSIKRSYTRYFKPYKGIVTARKLNIRKSPSSNSKIVGAYKRGNVINIIGQSGKYLKTDKGYIHSSYVSKYQSTSSSTRGLAKSFTTYKVQITAGKLNIRKSAKNGSRIVGYYRRGNIVDIIGQSGNYLKTSRGYIHYSYTKRYNPPKTPPKEVPKAPVVDNTGKYIIINSDTQLLLSINGLKDERYAVKGEKYKILAQSGEYYKIQFGRKLGYIHSSAATIMNEPYTDKITIAWDYIYAKSSNVSHYDDSSDFLRKSSPEAGLDVISPTWFYLSGDYRTPSTINVYEKADRDYVKYAHRNGYEVWALISEFNTERANKIFFDSTVRARVISQTVENAKKYDVDGVNIDFEGFGRIAENKNGFTQFVKELSTALKKEGFKVSVDVTKPVSYSVYSICYDRPAIAPYVDYMIYMAYDEHYFGCDTAGSVGSFPWVEAGIRDILNQGVPKEKLILGVPFYLRDFKLKDIYYTTDSIEFKRSGAIYKEPVLLDTNIIEKASVGSFFENITIASLSSEWYAIKYNDTIAYVLKNDTSFVPAGTKKTYVLSSEAISVKAAMDRISQYSGRIYFDNKALQNVGEYTIDGNRHLVWLEDKASMSWRMDLIRKYDLPGMGAWSLNWTIPEDCWKVIRDKLK